MDSSSEVSGFTPSDYRRAREPHSIRVYDVVLLPPKGDLFQYIEDEIEPWKNFEEEAFQKHAYTCMAC